MKKNIHLLSIGAFSMACCASATHAGDSLADRVGVIASQAGMASVAAAPMSVPAIQSLKPVETAAPGSARTAVIGEPLDPALLELGAAIAPRAQAELRLRLKNSEGKAAIVPLGPIDPTRKLVVFIPGIGLNFQDGHALAALEDAYQVVIAVYNQRNPLEENGRELADAVEALGRYRLALAAARGVAADRDLRLIGHSNGAISGEAMLGQLSQKGLIGAGPAGLFPRALFICMAAPWRGLDAPPGFASSPVQRALMGAISRFKPDIPATTLSLVNNSASMDYILELRLPDEITVRLVTPLLSNGKPQRSFGVVDPVASWYSTELARGELRRLWRFLKQPDPNARQLDGWGCGRTRALRQLWRTLERSSLFPAHEAELRDAATRLTTLDEFKARYDEIIAKIVDTFHGSHTTFMWEDPAFMPWLRKTFADW